MSQFTVPSAMIKGFATKLRVQFLPEPCTTNGKCSRVLSDLEFFGKIKFNVTVIPVIYGITIVEMINFLSAKRLLESFILSHQD